MKSVMYFVLSIIASGCGCYEYARSLRENIKPLALKGEVFNTFIDSSDRMTPKVILKNGDTSDIYSYEMYHSLERGDSIIKESGSLKYILKRRNEPLKEYYPQCDKTDIK